MQQQIAERTTEGTLIDGTQQLPSTPTRKGVVATIAPLWRWWLQSKSEDPDERFRENTMRITIAVVAILTGIGFGISQVLFHDPISLFSLPSIEGGALLFALAAGWAVVQRRLLMAGWLLVVMVAVIAMGFTGYVASQNFAYQTGFGSVMFIFITLLAALVLPAATIIPVSVASLALLAFLIQMQILTGKSFLGDTSPGGPGGLGGIVISNGLFIMAAASFLKLLRDEFDARLAREREEKKKADEAAQDADKANQLKSQFLASMSHELRTPLNSIIGYTDIMLAGMAPAEKHPELQRHVQNNANKLLGLINDILDLAKIESGKVQVYWGAVSPKKVVDDVVATMQGYIIKQKKDIYLKSEYTTNVPETVMTDTKKIQQVITNLISNAIKFTDKGGVTVLVSADKDAAHWIITVTDTGKGMPPDAKDYIFEKFRQVDGSDAREQQGTGLGLAITRNLVVLLGGKVDLQTELGKGTSFIVTLPTKPIESATAAAPAVTAKNA